MASSSLSDVLFCCAYSRMRLPPCPAVSEFMALCPGSALPPGGTAAPHGIREWTRANVPTNFAMSARCNCSKLCERKSQGDHRGTKECGAAHRDGCGRKS